MKKSKHIPGYSGIWIGDQESYLSALRAESWIMDNPEKAVQGQPKFSSEDELLDELTDIVLNISTSGGDAEGIGAVAENIRIADGMKPVYAFSNTKALSAGYWIASAAREISGSMMSEWGSIGALIVHTEYSKNLKENGLNVTVFRGGKFKALGHPAEKLTDKAEKLFQKKVDTLYNFQGRK